jgi:indolepyruvate ferredoxin oxidoreductase
VAAAAIEHAIRLNGVSVEMNLLAFRWGRLAVLDPRHVAAAARRATAATAEPRPLSREARDLVDPVAESGELRHLLEVRVPELIAYQDVAWARRYVEFVARVAEAERRQAPGRSGLALAVARSLYALMAYKDEYEVARLHTDPALRGELEARFGPGARIAWHLHPPILRALGLRRKLRLGTWAAPALRLLARCKALRGTPWDPFGRAQVRRVERALIDEYCGLVETALRRLGPDTHATAVALAETADLVRGYEEVKLAGVARFREAARELVARLG